MQNQCAGPVLELIVYKINKVGATPVNSSAPPCSFKQGLDMKPAQLPPAESSVQMYPELCGLLLDPAFLLPGSGKLSWEGPLTIL